MPKRQIPAAEPPPCLYLRMRLATRRLQALYEGHLRASGLSMGQFGLMIAIAEQPDMAMSQLAEKRELAPSTLTRTLRPLQESGLIEIFTDPENARIRRLRLTREGRARLRVGFAAWRRAQAEAEAIVPANAIAQVLRATENLPRAESA